MEIGLQLYTLREAMEEDFERVLRTVSEQGYEGVELAGTYGYSPADVKELLRKYQLTPISAHVPLEELTDDLQTVISNYKEIGCAYIVLPYIAEESRYGTAAFDEILIKMLEIGKICEENGIHFAYHNHDFEFAKTDTGSYVLDDMYDKIPKAYLQAELDTCWIAVAGESAEDYIRRYQDRLELVHMKDFKREDDVILTPLGKGVMDIKAVYNTAKECQVKWLIVEQDDHYGTEPFTNTDISIRCLKNIRNGEK